MQPGVEFREVDAFAIERIDTIGEEGAEMDFFGKQRAKFEHGRPSSAADKLQGLVKRADQLDAEFRGVGQVSLHHLAPRLEGGDGLVHAEHTAGLQRKPRSGRAASWIVS